MAAIALRESGGDPNAINHNTNGTTDRGLFQINDVWGPLSKQSLGNPEAAARAAVHVLKTQGLKAWATYNNGSYKQGMASVPASVQQNVGGNKSSLMSGNKQLALSLLGFGNLGGAYQSTDPVALALQATQQASTPSLRPQQTTAPAGKTPGGVTTFDGKPVAGWIAPILQAARKTGLWKGAVTSGERTKAQQLAAASHFGLQHYPNGPLASKHVYGHGGAVDVSDPQGLRRALQTIHNTRLKSSMPNDPVHFSRTGY